MHNNAISFFSALSNYDLVKIYEKLPLKALINIVRQVDTRNAIIATDVLFRRDDRKALECQKALLRGMVENYSDSILPDSLLSIEALQSAIARFDTDTVYKFHGLMLIAKQQGPDVSLPDEMYETVFGKQFKEKSISYQIFQDTLDRPVNGGVNPAANFTF